MRKILGLLVAAAVSVPSLGFSTQMAAADAMRSSAAWCRREATLEMFISRRAKDNWIRRCIHSRHVHVQADRQHLQGSENFKSPKARPLNGSRTPGVEPLGGGHSADGQLH